MRSAQTLLFLLLATASLEAQSSTDSLSELSSSSNEASVGDKQGSLEMIIDSFLRTYAADNIEWRTEVKVGVATSDSVPPAGFEKAKSELAGWFYYQPKTCSMLTVDERRSVMRDPRFPKYLAHLRKLSDGVLTPLPAEVAIAAKAPEISPAPPVLGRAEVLAKLLVERQMPPDPIHFVIAAEEMVMPGPLVITAHSTPAP